MKQKWKQINGFPNYSVSNLGVIKNNKTKVYLLSKTGVVKICDYKLKRRIKQIGRLVGEAFLKNPKNYMFVVHKDKNVLNNNVNNLFWGD